MLDAHLRRCDRCVEHERRLAQARDALARGFVEAHVPKPEPAAPVPSPDLRVIEEAIPVVEERVHGVEDRLSAIQESIEPPRSACSAGWASWSSAWPRWPRRLEEIAAARAEVPVEPAPVEDGPR